MFADIKNKQKREPLLDSCSVVLPPLRALTEQAKEQWHQAMDYFENVKDPELVDYAIKNLDAAEKRYDYLLKQMREQ